MIKSVKYLLSASLCALILLSGCTEPKQSSTEATKPQVTTTLVTEPTTVAPTTTAATSDTPEEETKKYNFLAIKQKSNVIDTKLKGIISDNHFQGSVYYKIGNDLEFIQSTGASNEIEHKNNSIHTCYYTGSFTKQLTATAILKLNEDGMLQLDDTLEKYFKDCEYADKVTVKNLLTMTSGIPSYVQTDDKILPEAKLADELDGKIKKDNSAKENKSQILKWILSQKTIIEPDSNFLYSDSDYYLLGEIIEKVSGKSYSDYISEAILKPLGMNHSGFTSVKDLAVGYSDNSEQSKLLYDNVGYSSLGFISNISDTLKFIEGLLKESVINNDSLLAMHTVYKGNFGYGVYINGDKISISSKIDAFSTKINYVTDESEIFVAYTNYASSDASYLHSLFKKYLAEFYI